MGAWVGRIAKGAAAGAFDILMSALLWLEPAELTVGIPAGGTWPNRGTLGSAADATVSSGAAVLAAVDGPCWVPHKSLGGYTYAANYSVGLTYNGADTTEIQFEACGFRPTDQVWERVNSHGVGFVTSGSDVKQRFYMKQSGFNYYYASSEVLPADAWNRRTFYKVTRNGATGAIAFYYWRPGVDSDWVANGTASGLTGWAGTSAPLASTTAAWGGTYSLKEYRNAGLVTEWTAVNVLTSGAPTSWTFPTGWGDYYDGGWATRGGLIATNTSTAGQVTVPEVTGLRFTADSDYTVIVAYRIEDSVADSAVDASLWTQGNATSTTFKIADGRDMSHAAGGSATTTVTASLTNVTNFSRAAALRNARRSSGRTSRAIRWYNGGTPPAWTTSTAALTTESAAAPHYTAGTVWQVNGVRSAFIHAVGVWDRLLSDAEVDLVGDWLRSDEHPEYPW